MLLNSVLRICTFKFIDNGYLNKTCYPIHVSYSDENLIF